MLHPISPKSQASNSGRAGVLSPHVGRSPKGAAQTGEAGDGKLRASGSMGTNSAAFNLRKFARTNRASFRSQEFAAKHGHEELLLSTVKDAKLRKCKQTVVERLNQRDEDHRGVQAAAKKAALKYMQGLASGA